MSGWYYRVRHPVRRSGAETYLLLMLVAFGGTVILTRWFLALAGYPQIASGDLHIAHAVWGGALLFIASLLPLLWAGRTTYPLSAVLSGIGVGLFADEVGKFISAENDYFHPAALPIAYATFLIATLVYLRFRHPAARDARSQLMAVLDELQEAVEHDLEPSERDTIARRLTSVMKRARSEDHRRLATGLLEFLNSPWTKVVPERSGPVERLVAWWRARRERILRGRGARVLVGLTLTLTGARAVVALAAVLATSVGLAVGGTASGGPLQTAQRFVEGFSGALLVPGVALIALGRVHSGIRLATLALVLALVVQDLIGFYLHQFDSVWPALFHLVLLVGLLVYQRPAPGHQAHDFPLEEVSPTAPTGGAVSGQPQ